VLGQLFKVSNATSFSNYFHVAPTAQAKVLILHSCHCIYKRKSENFTKAFLLNKNKLKLKLTFSLQNKNNNTSMTKII
jgi:hypothetical protein